MNNSTDVLYFWIGALCGVAALATIVVGVLYFRRKRERVKIKDDWEDVVGINTNSKRMRIFIGGKPISLDVSGNTWISGSIPITTSTTPGDPIVVTCTGSISEPQSGWTTCADGMIPEIKDARWLNKRLALAESAQDFELCAVIKKRLDELNTQE
jgi:hypothetical protein